MIAVGAECYSHGVSPSTGTGRSWNAEELGAAINGQVSALLFDDQGKADIQELLAGITETAFEQEQLAQVLAVPDNVEDWRVGEAIAEAYLTEHRACLFPWPDGRDERKSGSSLPGADLVGFQSKEDGIQRFAFGEVKTSSEKSNPPQVVTKKKGGLKKQIEDLRDKKKDRDGLVEYLAHRASRSSWKEYFKSATKRYLNNSHDVSLFGVLVRDVEPNKDDLRLCVQQLAEGCPNGTEIELLALYLPVGAIANLPSQVLAKHAGGGA
jgi:hypothetical protein